MTSCPATPIKRRRSFLPYLLIALCLLLFAIVLVPNTTVHRGSGDPVSPAQSDIAAFKGALETFNLDNGHYPSTAEGLDALVTQPPNTPHWHKLLDEVKLDPWGHPFRYTFPSPRSREDYDIISAGPAGLFNTADDINNLPTER